MHKTSPQVYISQCWALAYHTYQKQGVLKHNWRTRTPFFGFFSLDAKVCAPDCSSLSLVRTWLGLHFGLKTPVLSVAKAKQLHLLLQQHFPAVQGQQHLTKQVLALNRKTTSIWWRLKQRWQPTISEPFSISLRLCLKKSVTYEKKTFICLIDGRVWEQQLSNTAPTPTCRKVFPSHNYFRVRDGH